MNSTSVAVPVLVVNTPVDMAMVMGSVRKGFSSPTLDVGFTRFDLAKNLVQHIDQANESDMNLADALVSHTCRVRLPK